MQEKIKKKETVSEMTVLDLRWQLGSVEKGVAGGAPTVSCGCRATAGVDEV